MHRFRQFLFLFALVVIGTTTAAWAQTGVVRGTVVDVGGGVLPGANVMVQGTSIGAASDVDGEFTIRAVPAGPQVLVASYIGYQRVEVPVDVVAGETVTVEIAMSWEGLVGDEVVITAQARGQTQAINEQLASRSIVNVVSSDRIRELPDESAAAAVSRLPGVSLQNGDQIVVRGIEAKFNTVAVNGVQLPSTTTDRTTGIGFISSNMLAGIEVSKTVTPAMDANTIGGNVNLRLREAPAGFNLDAMLQGDYNMQDHTAGNYRTWLSMSNRFLNDRLGAFIQGNARRFDGGGDIATANWEIMGGADQVDGFNRMQIGEFAFTDEIRISNKYGASLLLDYRIPNGKLIWQTTYSHEDFDSQNFVDRLLLRRGQGGNREFEVSRWDGDRSIFVSSLQGEHGLADLDVDWSVSHSRTTHADDLGYITRFTGTGYYDPTGVRLLHEDDVFDLPVSNEHPRDAVIGNVEGPTEDYGERRWVGALNLSHPMTVGIISGDVRAGGKYTRMNRHRERPQYYQRINEGGNQNLGAADFLESIGWEPTAPLALHYFYDYDYADGRGQHYFKGRRPFTGAMNIEWLDNFFRDARTNWNPRVATSNRYNYEAQEDIAAGYLMADVNIGQYVSVIGGVRYENFSFENSAPYINQTLYDGSGGVLDTISVSRSRGDWFPNVQVQVRPIDWMDVRLAYTKTTSRPDFQRLLPNTWTDGTGGQAGNPNLEPTISNNFDAQVSFYNNRIGLFTVGAFAKELSNISRPISILRRTLDEFDGTYWAPVDGGYPVCEDGTQRISCPDGRPVADMGGAGRLETYVNNPYPGHIRGFEIDWQTNFWYLPSPLNSIVFNVNYTRLNSEMDYQSIQIYQPTPFTTAQRDTFRAGRLYQQADNILNMALGADVRGFSGRISFRYQGEVLSNLAQQIPQDDQFARPNYAWDFSIRQALPIDGLSLFFNGVNITSPAQYVYRRLAAGAEATEVTRANTRIAYYPARYQLGVRYRL